MLGRDGRQSADAALLVFDLAEPSCVEQLEDVHTVLHEKQVTLSERWDLPSTAPDDEPASEGDPFALRLPALLIANKSDRVADADAEFGAFREVTGIRYPGLAVSASTGHGLGELGTALFRHLGVVRVYTKTPGHAVDRTHPFTVRHGQTVRDVARLVHKDLERTLRYARVWGHSGFDGQQVGAEHVLADRDIIELHV